MHYNLQEFLGDKDIAISENFLGDLKQDSYVFKDKVERMT